MIKATKKIGAVSIEIERLDSMAGLRGLTLALQTFGDGGLRMLCSPDTDTIKIPDKAATAEARREGKPGPVMKVVELETLAVMPGLLAQADSSSVDRLLSLLLCGKATVHGEDGPDAILEGEAGEIRIRELLEDLPTLLRAFRFALQHNFGPTLAAANMSGSTPQASTAAKSAAK